MISHRHQWPPVRTRLLVREHMIPSEHIQMGYLKLLGKRIHLSSWNLVRFEQFFLMGPILPKISIILNFKIRNSYFWKNSSGLFKLTSCQSVVILNSVVIFSTAASLSVMRSMSNSDSTFPTLFNEQVSSKLFPGETIASSQKVSSVRSLYPITIFLSVDHSPVSLKNRPVQRKCGINSLTW